MASKDERSGAGAPNSLTRAIALTVIARFAHDVAARVVYPFLPEIAAGLRVPIDRAGQLLSLRSGLTILSPFAGAAADRIGHRRSMSMALALLAVGLFVIGSADGLPATTIGFILSGAASALYLPAQLAYIGERTPYERRGRVFGAIEMTWAAAGIVGIPAMALLINPLGWRAPFVALSISAALCAALTLILEETPHPERSGIFSPRSRRMRFRSIFGVKRILRLRPANRCGPPLRMLTPFRDLLSLFKLIVRNRSVIALLLAWLLLFVSFENIQVGYASWFESHFGMSAGERGLTQTLFSLFEIAASFSSSLFLDRIGKKRGVTAGLIVALAGYILLTTIGSVALWLGLASMSVAFLGFEFSVVSGLPIASEQLPQARGTMLALLIMSGGLGRMLGAISGGAFAAGAGFTTGALASACVVSVAVALFAWGVRE